MLAAALAVFTAAAVSVVVADPDPASTVTIVSQVTRAEIVLADGTERSATMVPGSPTAPPCAPARAGAPG